ncbi:MAG: transposase [Sphaerochaeta sp.]|nr:transposase [Sphaerochaeta sp.]
MAHIYWELKEIPQPAGSYINKSDGRVFVFSSGDTPVRKSKRKVIGHATSETMMHPNDTFKYLFPNLWNEHYGSGKLPEHILHSGLYGLTLGIGYETGLYPIVQGAYGPLYGNILMDYAMYSILERSDVSLLFPDRMAQQVLFSKHYPSDSWLSDFFLGKINENDNAAFRSQWLDECKKRGVTKAWISIDGSNNNCDSVSCTMAEKGHAKSRENTNIVSYMYAVNAEDGRPITYTVYNGGKVDSKAIQKMAAILASHGIEIVGIILDRGFCTYGVFELLDSLGYPYVVMLQADTFAHSQMVAQHSETIRWRVPYAVGEKGLFGISEKKRLFHGHMEEAFVNLFFDASNGSQRSLALIAKILKATKVLKAEIQKGKRPVVPQALAKYISLRQEGDTLSVEHDYAKWQKDVDLKGFCSIASSEDFGPEEVDRIYHLRDASESQYSILKTQLGYDVTRVHSTPSIQNKFCACFIAAIIRGEIMNACKGLGYATNQMIREVDRIELLLLPNGTYAAIHDESARAKELLALYDIIPSDFDSIATEVNNRLVGSMHSQVREKPSHEKQGSRKKGRPTKAKDKAATGPKRGPGRPKGSVKNNETALQEGKVQRKPGRPKGSKNKVKSDALTSPDKWEKDSLK